MCMRIIYVYTKNLQITIASESEGQTIQEK